MRAEIEVPVMGIVAMRAAVLWVGNNRDEDDEGLLFLTPAVCPIYMLRFLPERVQGKNGDAFLGA